MKTAWIALVALAYAPSFILLGLLAAGWAPETEVVIHGLGVYIPAISIVVALLVGRQISTNRRVRFWIAVVWPVYIFLAAGLYVSIYVNTY